MPVLSICVHPVAVQDPDLCRIVKPKLARSLGRLERQHLRMLLKVGDQVSNWILETKFPEVSNVPVLDGMRAQRTLSPPGCQPVLSGSSGLACVGRLCCGRT